MSEESPDSSALREAKVIAISGVALFALLVVGFSARLGFGFADAVLLALLLELLPVLSVAQLPLVGAVEVERLAVYLQSSVLLALIGSGALIVGARSVGLEAMGLGPANPADIAVWTVILVVGSAFVHGVAWLLTRWTPLSESPLVANLLPQSSIERRSFTAVSFVAGVNEEIAFRGYAIPALAGVLGGPWGAAAFTSVVFGLLHSYQGLLGIGRTALLGLLFATSFVLSGSLWPAIATHVAIDLFMGLGPGERLLASSG